MKQTVYSCDWCYAEAPKRDSIGEDWVYISEEGRHPSEPLIICGTCAKVRNEALRKARESREPKIKVK